MTERVDILINARNQASGAVNQVKASLSGLDGAAKGLSGGLAGIAGFVGAGAIVGLAQQAAGAGAELVKAGADALEMRDALDHVARTAGVSGRSLLEAARAASEGMVADRDLVSGLNQAVSLHAVQSAQQVTELMKIAVARSDIMGMSVGDAFNTIAEGVGKLQERQLAALGITLDTEQVYEKYAAGLGITADKLNEAQKRQALYNAVVADSAPIVAEAAASAPSAADKIDVLGAALQNMKDFFGAAAAEIIMDSPKVQQALKGIQDMTAWTQDDRPFLEKFLDLIMPARVEARALADEVQGANDAFRQGERESWNMAAAQAGVAAWTRTANMALGEEKDALSTLEGAANSYKGKLNALLPSLAAVIGMERALVMSHYATGIALARDAVRAQLGFSEEQRALLTQMDLQEVEAQWQPIIDAPEEARQAAEKAMRAAQSDYERMVSATQAAFDDLAGKVQGVLQAALDPGVGDDWKQNLPREDDINENARRVAAIATEGFKGQSWLEDFRSDVPDIAKALEEAADPKAAAARLLADFQDGLVPELLDKETAKQRVKRMLLGEANLESMAQEIAQELSQELGVGLQDAQAATGKVLGTGGGEGQTGAAASGGLDGSAAGAQFVDGMTTAIVERHALLVQSGEAAGAQWKTGFLSVTTVDIPTALVAALALLVTPAVLAAIAQQKGREGAN